MKQFNTTDTGFVVGQVTFAPAPSGRPAPVPRRVQDVVEAWPQRKMHPVRAPGGAGEVRLMAVKDGYVMARRPGKMPFVMTLHDWLALDDVVTP